MANVDVRKTEGGKQKCPKLDVLKKNEKLNWDHINIIDVCESEDKFQSFVERLEKETTISMALGCRQKGKERKNIIGMRISKKRKTETAKDSSSKFCYKDIILDGIAFYLSGNDVHYLSFNEGSDLLSQSIDLLKRLENKVCRAFDTKEQIKMLQRCCSFTLNCSFQDPKIANWLLSEQWKEKNFTSITLEHVPMARNLVSALGSVVGFSSPGLLAKSSLSAKARASFEAFLTFHVISKQLQLLQGKGLLKIFEKTEMPVLLCLAETELTGFPICREKLLKSMSDIEKAKENLENKAYEIAQYKFSLSSSAAVTKVLLKVLNLNEDKLGVTKKKKIPSINKECLQEIANETKHVLPEVILQWRKIRSMLTKFISPLLQLSSESARVFGVCHSFTVTGRISMHEPNLQNIPRNFAVNYGERDDVSINLRDVFVASENFLLMSVDYCQIELRMLAHLSKDPILVKDIEDSSDIFVSIAAKIYNIFNHEVDDKLRQRAKQTCYGIIYGIGPRHLSQQLEINESDAVELMEGFKKKYQGVGEYLKEIVENCKKKGHVTSLLGRRRYLPAIHDPNQGIRMEAERQAINTTIQGSAADLVKTAMVSLRHKLDQIKNEFPTRLVLHLHDELIFEVGKDAVQTIAFIMKDTLENAMDLLVPTPVKIKTGSSWGKLENYE